MKQFYCQKHGYEHTNDGGWTYTKWETENETVWGWVCANVRYPEFTSQKIKDDRITYAPDMIQSHRSGNLSREFVELYPDRVKKMVKEGVITKDEVKKSKNVWKEVKGWEKEKKVDAEALVK